MNRLHKLFAAAVLAAFFMAPAQAQNAGTVTANAFAVGNGPGVDGFASVLCAQAQIAIGQNAAKPICAALSGDVTMTAAGVTAIGASKVTNSMLATMAANTTKCNATAGTANPTDCNASTMRTNIGVVIGTNVEAWDTDLDCLAALSSTGVISRTGSGTCSAGALALSGLATGTQDTVIGYWGSTTATAIAINNCTGALTYSTTTHTFGCNVSGGTGTVTTITSGYGVSLSSGATCTTTCTAAVSLTGTFTSILGSDVNLNNTATYFDGPSVNAGTSGRFLAIGKVTLSDPGATAAIDCKLWDGTTVIDSGRTTEFAINSPTTMALQGFILNPAANIKISCKDASNTTGKMIFNASGNSKDTSLNVLQIQ